MMIRSLTLAAALLTFVLPLNANADSTTMPACAANDPVVWVNTKSHVYHGQGDAYFGKTKSGTYACTSKAVSMGAHLAGAKAAGKPSGAAVDAPDDSATTAPHMSKRKKKHAGALPAPDQ